MGNSGLKGTALSSWCCGLKVCILAKIHMLNVTPQGDGIEKQGFWDVIPRHRDGISILTKEDL